MQGHSPFIHLLHLASTFAALGGDVNYKGQDIGFLGDQSPSQSPLPVRLPTDTWKWIAKPASLDVLALENTTPSQPMHRNSGSRRQCLNHATPRCQHCFSSQPHSSNFAPPSGALHSSCYSISRTTNHDNRNTHRRLPTVPRLVPRCIAPEQR